MTFNNILAQTHCNCLEDSFENYSDTFARRSDKSPSPKARDFKSYYEGGKIVEDLNNCQEVCGHRGVSLEIWNADTRDKILEKFLESAQISPQFRKVLNIIRLKSNAGIVKYTPEQGLEYNEFHYDFYKSDDFQIDMIELVEQIRV